MAQEISWAKRLRIVKFAPHADMSVDQFCAREAISRASFYRLRARAGGSSGMVALPASSRAPTHPDRTYGGDVWERVSGMHDALEGQGLDAGAITIWFHLTQEDPSTRMSPVPSVSTIQRILKRCGKVEANKKKRPRSSYLRFQRKQVNELWQIDGVDWTLGEDGPVCIYQVIDDASRVLTALMPYPGEECGEGARNALSWGFGHYGIPLEVLSDNGVAFNTHRLGRLSRTEVFLAELGVVPISGRVGKPTTQGKDERSHQPMQKWLTHHRARTIGQLATTLEDFRTYYNTLRPHQGLTPLMTPWQAWQIKPHAPTNSEPIDQDALLNPPPPGVLTPTHAGNIRYEGHMIYVGKPLAGIPLTVRKTPLSTLRITTPDGTQLATIAWPPPTTYTSLHPRNPENHQSQKS